MQYFVDILTVTATSAGLFEAYDLVGFDNLKVTGADAAVKGVAKSPSTEIGQQIGVIVIGLARVKAVGAITAGAKLVSAAAGGVQVAGGSPVNVFARALTAAADAEFVEILIL